MKFSKRVYILLAIIFLGFFALGLPDGAFGVAWPHIRQELDVPLERAGFIFVVHSIFYALTTSQLGRISRFIKEENIGVIGLFGIALGLLGFSIAPYFFVLICFVAILGMSMGFVDSSFNAYVSKNFSGRVMNLLHCFWGVGAMISPLIMTSMVMNSTWRSGYAFNAMIVTAVAISVLISVTRGFWRITAPRKEAVLIADFDESDSSSETAGYLRGRINESMAVVIFFFYGGAEYGIGYWAVSVLVESRNMYTETAGLYPAAFYGSIMLGRLVFGLIGNRVRDINALRLGVVLSAVGLVSFLFTTSIIGMLLIGFGFGPIIPSAVSDISRRFNPTSTTRLVGYQFAALGSGIAILATGLGWFLGNVSLEILFPAVLFMVLTAGLLNEILEHRKRT